MTVFNPGLELRRKSIFQLLKGLTQACSARKREAKELTTTEGDNTLHFLKFYIKALKYLKFYTAKSTEVYRDKKYLN